MEERLERFYGPPLYRAARIQALATGGETLIAGGTVDLVGGRAPEGSMLRYLGEQRLRDVPEPERIFALVHTARARSAGGPTDDEPEPEHRSDSVSDESGPIRVLLVDDHAVVRRGLRGFLELIKDFDVVGEAENGREGVAAADRLVPDVILMDLLMPEMGGLEAIGAIKQAHPEIEIVAVTSFIEEEKVTSALEAGASGYLLKDAEAEEVAQAIRAAYNGEVHLDPAVSRLLAQRLRQRKDAEPVEPLTTREKEVLSQLAKGASNKEIAYELGITERTAQDPRQQHPRQARSRVAHTGRPLRGRAQARLDRCGSVRPCCSCSLCAAACAMPALAPYPDRQRRGSVLPPCWRASCWPMIRATSSSATRKAS